MTRIANGSAEAQPEVLEAGILRVNPYFLSDLGEDGDSPIQPGGSLAGKDSSEASSTGSTSGPVSLEVAARSG